MQNSMAHYKSTTVKYPWSLIRMHIKLMNACYIALVLKSRLYIVACSYKKSFNFWFVSFFIFIRALFRVGWLTVLPKCIKYFTFGLSRKQFERIFSFLWRSSNFSISNSQMHEVLYKLKGHEPIQPPEVDKESFLSLPKIFD